MTLINFLHLSLRLLFKYGGVSEAYIEKVASSARRKAQSKDEILSLLAARSTFGRAFFDAAAGALIAGLGCRWCGIGRLDGEEKGVQLLAFRDGESAGEPFAYDLAGAPCEAVYLQEAGKSYSFYGDRIAEKFPKNPNLAKIGAVSYRGAAFHDGAGDPLGHVFTMGDRAESDDAEAKAFFQLVVQDVGAEFARWQAEEALRERAAALAKAQRLAQIGDWRWSLVEDALLSCSEEFARLHGLGLDDIAAQMAGKLQRFVHPEDVERVAEAYGKLSREAPDYAITYRIVLPDGGTRQVLGLGEAVFDGSGQAMELIGTVQDITARTGTEHIETVENITAGNGAAEPLDAPEPIGEASREPNLELTAKISHELRSPLNVIVGFSEIIKEEMFGPVGNDKYRGYATDIYQAGLHLVELVSNDMDLSKTPAAEDPDKTTSSKFPESYKRFRPL